MKIFAIIFVSSVIYSTNGKALGLQRHGDKHDCSHTNNKNEEAGSGKKALGLQNKHADKHTCDEDPCETFICQNGGTCSVNPEDNTAQCQCAAGFEGVNCETQSCTVTPMVPGDGIDNNCNGQLDEQDCRFGALPNDDCMDPCFDPTVCAFPTICSADNDGDFSCIDLTG